MEQIDNNIYNNKMYFSGLHEKSFLHPTDAFALSTVKKLKGLDILINAMNKISYEKLFRIQSMGDDVKVTKKTCGNIYHKVELCAKILNMPIPDVFINQNPSVNAFTTGTDSPMIQLYSGIIDYMDDEELLAVLAHEMGHIKCGHVLYHTAASALKLGTGFLGPLEIFTDFTFSLTLLEWERKSEFSADRAALLVTQDIKPVLKVLMKIAGGSKKTAEQIDYDDFIKQSKEYQSMSETLTGKAYKAYLNLLRTHPFPVMRASEIDAWAKSKEYESILKEGVRFFNNDIRIEFDTIPLHLKAISEQPKSIPLSWDIPLVSNIIGYRLYRSNVSDCFFNVIYEITGRLTKTFVDKNLEDGIKYFYYLTSIDAYNNESKPSEYVFAVTKQKPISINNFSITINKAREVELFWEEYNVSKISKININIYRCINFDNDHFKKIAIVDCNKNSRYVDTKLKDNTLYSYYLEVEDEGVVSLPSDVLYIKTKSLINCPVGLKSYYDFQSGRVCLSWKVVVGAVSYNIYEKCLIIDKKIINSISSNCFFTIKFKKGNKLVFYVKAVDESNIESEKSEITVIE